MKEFIINNRVVTYQEILNGTSSSQSDNEKHVFEFVQDWLNGQQSFTVNTSGSTGTPKTIEITREQMILSAQRTGSFLNLQHGNTALICLSAEHIAGKMMLVRSIELGLKATVIDARSDPFAITNQAYDFTALVPLQVQTILNENLSKTLFHQTNNIIIGGSPLNSTLEKQLIGSKNHIFQTYGMTETVSHVALKNISKGEKTYKALPGVSFSVSDKNCLQINAPMAKSHQLSTNDIVELLSPTSFIWKGRADFVINSGGIKIQTEELETKTSELFTSLNVTANFFIFSQKDDFLGEKVCLCIEGSPLKTDLLKAFNSKLPKYHIPKSIYYLDQLVFKKSGKLDRKGSVGKLNLV